MMRSTFACGLQDDKGEPCRSTFKEPVPFRKHLKGHDVNLGRHYGGSISGRGAIDSAMRRAVHLPAGVNLVDALNRTWDNRFNPHWPSKTEPLGDGIEELTAVKVSDLAESIPAAVSVECNITPAILERMTEEPITPHSVQIPAAKALEPETPLEEPSPPVPVEPGRARRRKYGEDEPHEQLCDRCWTKKTFADSEKFCAECRVRGRVSPKCR
jgi:hypothetical protein